MPSGLEVRAALKKAVTWGTPVACGANDGVLLKGDSLKRAIESYPEDSLGQPFVTDRDQGEIKAEGGLEAYLRYDSLDLLIALVMGATGGAPTQQGATTAYAQKFTLADDLDGLFATVAVNKKVNVFEYPSAKLTGFTIKGEMGKPVEVSFDVLADDEDPASTTNDLTSFANVTYAETANRVLMSQGVFRLNDESGAALGSGDEIKPSSFELTFKRPLEGAYIVGGDNRIDEPAMSGLPEVTLNLTFPRYTATTYLTALGADTRKKMDIVFTGALIETPYNREFKLQFPHLALLNAEAATAEGQIEHPLEFSCLATDTAPAGMTGILKPFQVDVINKQSTDVLA
jgi:hypothetical protein